MTKRTCPYCSTAIPADAHGGRIYCSKSCSRKSTYRRKYPDRHVVGGGECKLCSGVIPIRPGSVEPTYCSTGCRRDAQSASAKVRYEATKDQVNAAKRAENAAKRAATVKDCAHCASRFSPDLNMRQMYCSKKCLRDALRDSPGQICTESDCGRPVRAKSVCNMHYKRLLRAEGRMNDKNWTPRKAANWKKRHALARGAADAEQFDYREIFDRDGWSCGICAEPVDPNLAWPDPMSVSLDHIIPVSKGGSHVRDNVQCSHLTCNLRKSNHLEVA